MRCTSGNQPGCLEFCRSVSVSAFGSSIQFILQVLRDFTNVDIAVQILKSTFTLRPSNSPFAGTLDALVFLAEWRLCNALHISRDTQETFAAMNGGIYDRITGLKIGSSESGTRPEASIEQARQGLPTLYVISTHSTYAVSQLRESCHCICQFLYCRRICIVSETAHLCNVVVCNNSDP